MESNGTWGYLIGKKLHYLIKCQKVQLVHGQRNHEKYFVHVSLTFDDLAIVEVHFQSFVKRAFATSFSNAFSVSGCEIPMYYLWKAERDVCVIVGRAVLLLPLLEPLHDALHRRKVLHHVAQDLPRLRRHFLTNFALRELKFEYALLPKSS